MGTYGLAMHPSGHMHAHLLVDNSSASDVVAKGSFPTVPGPLFRALHLCGVVALCLAVLSVPGIACAWGLDNANPKSYSRA